MKRIVCRYFGMMLVWVSLVVSGGLTVYGQNSIEQLKSEFDKGNRDTQFLKEYVEVLKAKGQADELGNVLDCYLMTLPFEQRYTNENVKDFITHVNGFETESLLDVVANWSKLSLNDEQKSAIVEKIDQLCPATVLNWNLKHKENPDLKMPDFSLLQRSLSNSAIPVGASKRALIGMWQSYCKKDIPRIIKDMKVLFSSSIEFHGMFDWVMFGYIGNYLLEESDLAQCKEVISLMEKALEDYSKNGDMFTVEKLKEDFVGKGMMLEMGEE